MTSSSRNTSSHWRTDAALVWTLRGLAALAGAIVLLIVVFLVLESLPALRDVGIMRFLTDQAWYPTLRDPDTPQFNMVPMIAGSAAVTVGSILLAAPLGIASALLCRYYAPKWFADFYRRLMQVLAGMPSVVLGLFALVVWAPVLSHCLFTGILVLTVMILPTVALLTEASLAAVPRSLEQGAVALGLTRWAMIRRVLLPAARSGVVTSVILAVGRAIGETMAVALVCGNIVQMPTSLATPIRTLTANIALEMPYSGAAHRSALFVSGLLLLAVVIVLVILANWLGKGADDHA